MTTPTLAAMLAVLLAFGYLGQTVPAFGRALAGLGDRERQIDGLRGICALAVAAHHLAHSTHWARGDGWNIPVADHFLLTMGKAAVGMFFLICAYLFWGKISRSEELSRPVDFRMLLLDRANRLVPAYILAVTAALVIIGGIGQGFVLHQTYTEAFVQIIRAYAFSFLGFSYFNRDFLTFAAVSVAWSLQFEWMFYFSLPLIKAMHMTRHWILFSPLFIVTNQIYLGMSYLDFFAFGGMAYEISRIKAIREILAGRVSDAVSLGAAIGGIYFFSPSGISHGLGAAVLALSFVPIACGARWFGLLTLAGAWFIGSISYSMYLFNIIVFYICLKFLNILGNSDLAMFSIDTIMLVVLTLSSFASFTLVERRFMKKEPASRKTTSP